MHTRSKTTRERERESWLSARSKESGNGSSSILNSSSRFLYILENFLLLLIIYCEIYFILLIFEEIENFLLLLLLIIYLYISFIVKYTLFFLHSRKEDILVRDKSFSQPKVNNEGAR